jgi:phosphopentomutase
VKRRAFVVVLDACGAGALPDSDAYGDEGANTLGHLAEAVGGLSLPVMERLGLGSILTLEGVPPAGCPVAHGRLHPLGPGKDTTAGHWELMGVVAEAAPPTYPGGFPPAVLEKLRTATGRGLLCGAPYNGIAAIDDFGEAHVASGDLIVYTSQDSVVQIAAHVEVMAPEELYRACQAVRAVMDGEDAVGRVIARPFEGEPRAFKRTDGRRDFALPPPSRSYLDALRDSGVPVHAVGKVGQVFAGRGIDEEHPGATNARAVEETSALMDRLEHGLVFTNLVETDQVYGHRKDVAGFHAALQAIDAVVGAWLERLDPARDLLVLTADHGCDPASAHTDHTREYAPLLACFDGHGGRRHDGPMADVGASVLRWTAGRDDPGLPGTSFLP